MPTPLLSPDIVAALASEASGSAALHTSKELTLHHRQRGSRGYRAAAEAILRRLRAYGLEDAEILSLPTDGEIFYGTQRSRPAWDADFAELWELASAGEGTWRKEHLVASWEEQPITLAQDSDSGRVEAARLVDVGAGTDEADYAGKEVRGQLVLTSSQPGAVQDLAVGRLGAAGIVSYAQNQRTGWWKEDETLLRWGHLSSFPDEGSRTFAFMVSLRRARDWQERLARGEEVRLSARVEAGRHPGSYDLVTAVLPGSDPALRRQEIILSCHLDHQRPGANDNASGCATILEVARLLAKGIAEGTLPRPRRSIRFLWPPEIEGTLAYINGKPDLASRALAVIHMDMVGGDPAETKAVFHVTRSPGSLPTFVNGVAEAFAELVNRESNRLAATGEARFPLLDPAGGKEPLRAEAVTFTEGSDHEVWTEGSVGVPAIYLNDWPDRYIHTHRDLVAHLDATKLKRVAFLGAASAYYLARLEESDLPELLDLLFRQAVARTAETLERIAQVSLTDPEAVGDLARFRLDYEERLIGSLAPFVTLTPGQQSRAAERLRDLRRLLAAHLSPPPPTGAGAAIYRRRSEPKGILSAFGYSYLDDHLERLGLERPLLLQHRGFWGDGSLYAYEALNLADGQRNVAEIRSVLTALYGPVPLDMVRDILTTLEAVGLVTAVSPDPP